MAKNERIDESISSWLEETAQPRLPERVLEATFARTRRAGSRSAGARSWRTSECPDSCPRSAVRPSS